MTRSTTKKRVVEDYFQTTSKEATTHDSAVNKVSVDGLKRHLGTWLDVKGCEVLDLGSGTGDLCQAASEEKAKSVTGVNLSLGEIEFARSRCDATFVHQDIADFLRGSADESVDRVYTLNILEHLDKEQLVDVLEGVARVLRPGGALVAMVPNATSPFGGMTRYWDITHEIAFTPSSVRQLAKLTGFSDPRFKECGPIPHGILSSIRYVLWQGIRLLIAGYLMVELADRKGGIYTADFLFRLSKPGRPALGSNAAAP